MRSVTFLLFLSTIHAIEAGDTADTLGDFDQVGSGEVPPPPPPMTPASHRIDVKVRDNMVQVHDREVSGGDAKNTFYKVQTNGGGFMSTLNAEQSSAGENASSVHFAVHVQEILEVLLTDDDAGCQPELDTVVKSARIGAQNQWTPFVAGTETVDNVTVSTFSVHDKMHFYARGAIALSKLSGYDASADYVKYDFAIRRWPYSTEHARTVLALKVLVIATQDDWKPAPFKRDGKPEGKIDFAGEAASANAKAEGFLTWKKSAAECPWGASVGSHCSANATSASVIATRGHGKWVYFTMVPANRSAPRGDIVWDPEIGAVMSVGPASPPTASGIGAAGIVGITVSSLAVLGLALNPSVHRKARAVARSSVGRLTGAGTEATPATNYARHDDDV